MISTLVGGAAEAQTMKDRNANINESLIEGVRQKKRVELVRTEDSLLRGFRNFPTRNHPISLPRPPKLKSYTERSMDTKKSYIKRRPFPLSLLVAIPSTAGSFDDSFWMGKLVAIYKDSNLDPIILEREPLT